MSSTGRGFFDDAQGREAGLEPFHNVRCTCGKFVKYAEAEYLVMERGYSVDEAFAELGVVAPCCQMNIRPEYISSASGLYNVQAISGSVPLSHDVHRFSSSSSSKGGEQTSRGISLGSSSKGGERRDAASLGSSSSAKDDSEHIPWRSMVKVKPAAPKSLKMMTAGKRTVLSIPTGRPVTTESSSSITEPVSTEVSAQENAPVKPSKIITVPASYKPVEDSHTGYRGPGKVVGYVDVGGGLKGNDKRYLVPILERSIKSE